MEHRNSKVAWPGVSRGGGNLQEDGKESELHKLLDEFGIALEEEARKENIDIFLFPIFREFNLLCSLTARLIVYVFFSSAGGMPSLYWFDWRKETIEPTIEDIVEFARRRLGWTSVSIISLPLDILEKNMNDRRPTLQVSSRKWIQDVILEYEKKARIVKYNPIFIGRDFMLEPDLCFVIMPFREPFERIYKENMKPVIETANLRVMRANDIFMSTSIIEDIWAHINKSRFIVADVSEKNPNVFYELGIAHTIGKEVIIFSQNEEDIPFDLRPLRYFLYVDNQDGWLKLREDLKRAINVILER